MHVCLLFNLQLYPFGQSENDAVLPPALDINSPRIMLSEEFIIYDQIISTVYVCYS